MNPIITVKEPTVIVLEPIKCYKCGIVFGMPDYHRKQLLDTEASFWCPNGHEQHFTESEASRLKRSLKNYQEWYEAEHKDHEATKRRLSAAKGVVTRTKNRIAKGLCPKCHKHFPDLDDHMQTEHPGYGEAVASEGE